MSAQSATTAIPAQRRTGARRERRHLRPVHDGPRSHPLLFFLLYAAIAIGAVVGAVTLNALAAEDAVTLSGLDADVASAERSYGELVAQVAALEDPERIRMLAEQMGMEPATPRYLVPAQSLPDDQEAGATSDPLKPVITAQR